MRPRQLFLVFFTPLAALAGEWCAIHCTATPYPPAEIGDTCALSADWAPRGAAHFEVRIARTIDSQSALASPQTTFLPLERWQGGPTGLLRAPAAKPVARLDGRVASLSVRLDGHFLLVEHIRLQI